jgi:AcrR family transcriptional regulator
MSFCEKVSLTNVAGEAQMDGRRAEMASEDHRTRVAAERRERMQARLVESALLVFGQRGMDASVIDELIRIAGVSRGTFYNYFRTNEDLLLAVSLAVSDEMMRVVDPLAQGEPDPAARIAAGLWVFIELARDYPVLSAFLSRGGLRVLTEHSLVKAYLPRDLVQARDSGRIRISDIDLAFDLVVGPTLTALHRMQSSPLPDGYSAELVSAILQGLGLPAQEAKAIAHRPLPRLELPPDSLLARAAARAPQDRPLSEAPR